MSLLGIFQAAAAITAVLSIVTLLSIDNFGVQLFTHFRLQYLAILLLYLALYPLLQSPLLIGVLAVAVVANAFLVLPWYFGKEQPPANAKLKLMHANVLSRNTNYEKLLKLVEAEHPDLIVLQEVTPLWEQELRKLQTDYPFGQVEARRGNFGIALLSRLPLTSTTVTETRPLAYPTIVADVSIGEQSLRLVTTHPTIPVNGQLYLARNEQLTTLPRLLESDSEARILVGDLNATMWDMKYRNLEGATGLRNARKGFGVVPTWPTYLPFARIPIDHVLVSDAVNVHDIKSGPSIGSDHFPLIVTMSL